MGKEKRIGKPEDYEPRACMHCGELFTPTRKDRRYCSSLNSKMPFGRRPCSELARTAQKAKQREAQCNRFTS